MSDKVQHDKLKIQGQVSIALNAIDTLLQTNRVLDNLLYGLRYPADEDIEAANLIDADSPYQAIGESYDTLQRMNHALTELMTEVKK